MPTGFDGIESGAELSQKLLNMLQWLDTKLKTTSILKPLTGKQICRECRLERKIELEGPDVRAMVNYLRRSGKPLGSQADGYFYATQRQHLDGTILHLRERIRGIQSALKGLEIAQTTIAKGQQELL